MRASAYAPLLRDRVWRRRRAWVRVRAHLNALSEDAMRRVADAVDARRALVRGRTAETASAAAAAAAAAAASALPDSRGIGGASAGELSDMFVRADAFTFDDDDDYYDDDFQCSDNERMHAADASASERAAHAVLRPAADAGGDGTAASAREAATSPSAAAHSPPSLTLIDADAALVHWLHAAPNDVFQSVLRFF